MAGHCIFIVLSPQGLLINGCEIDMNARLINLLKVQDLDDFTVFLYKICSFIREVLDIWGNLYHIRIAMSKPPE